MSHYEKYLKYKGKYFQLLNAPLQVGGGKPQVAILKNIGLFEQGSLLDQHLNPIHGFFR